LRRITAFPLRFLQSRSPWLKNLDLP
jgi:hypothetical protein